MSEMEQYEAYLVDCIKYLDEMIACLDKADSSLEELKSIVVPSSGE